MAPSGLNRQARTLGGLALTAISMGNEDRMGDRIRLFEYMLPWQKAVKSTVTCLTGLGGGVLALNRLSLQADGHDLSVIDTNFPGLGEGLTLISDNTSADFPLELEGVVGAARQAVTKKTQAFFDLHAESPKT